MAIFMKYGLVIFLTGLLFFLSCKNQISNSRNDIKISRDVGSQQAKVTGANDDGPPFNDTCLCDFKEFGTNKISNSNYNSYYCGKGVNFKHASCAWIWSELIYNEVSDDTNVYIMKVHLLDLVDFKIPSNHTIYGNDSIKKYVIAIFQVNTKTGKNECFYDPFKTGKYKQ